MGIAHHTRTQHAEAAGFRCGITGLAGICTDLCCFVKMTVVCHTRSTRGSRACCCSHLSPSTARCLLSGQAPGRESSEATTDRELPWLLLPHTTEKLDL